MPIPRTWLPRLPEILDHVQAWPTKELDRDAVAQIFALKRRAALALMKEIGPVRLRTGRWILLKETLLQFGQAQEKEAAIELGRKQRFTDSLRQADTSLPRRPSILLAPRKFTPEQRKSYAAELPEGVKLQYGSPNCLTVEFQTMEELAERLLATGISMNDRFSEYQEMLEPSRDGMDDEDRAEQEDAEYFRNWQPEKG